MLADDGRLQREPSASRKAFLSMLAKLSTKGARSLEWCTKECLALLEARAAQCAGKGLVGEQCAQFTLTMERFVVDKYAREYGVPKLAREKMLTFLKAVKAHVAKRKAVAKPKANPSAMDALTD